MAAFPPSGSTSPTGRSARAAARRRCQLVLSALELPTRNNQTLSIVADRLMRYGEIDRAIWLLERLLAAEDDRPQPRRTLALALAKRAESAPREQARADLARAISLLTEVVMTPWDNAYDGIEMISLMEANRLHSPLPGARRRGTDARSAADRAARRRSARLDRMEQRGDRRRPVGRRADRRAGHLSQSANRERRPAVERHDPRVRSRRNISSAARRAAVTRCAPTSSPSDRIDPNGAQRVTARIIRDFGRPTEHEEVVDIELLPNDQTRERRVGTVRFDGPSRRSRDRN